MATDFDGNFSIQAATGDVLVVSYVGYADQRLTVDAQDNYTLTLLPDNALEEVVILGYGSQKRSEVTGSAVQVGSDQIQNFPVTSADQVLQGKVAGLSLSTTSGIPGSTQSILIRGQSSITACNAPLFVIDGVPVSNAGIQRSTAASTFSPLANINPENIESITVLKDPSATAPYGARGTNGVIVITTKKGTSTEPLISFSTTYGFQNDAINGPTMLTGAQREELYYEGLFNTYGESENFTRAEAEQFYRDNPTRFGTRYVVWNDNGRKETKWADYITNKDAPIKTVDLNFSGRTDKTNYFFSVGYLDQEATVIGAFAERFSGADYFFRF